MTFRTKSLGLAAILATTVSGAAFAQSDNVTSEYGAESSGAGAAVSADLTPGFEQQGEAANVTSEYGDASQTADISGDISDEVAPGVEAQGDSANVTSEYGEPADIATIDNTTVITPVMLSSTSVDVDALSEDDMGAMRTSIGANSDLAAALEAEGYDSDDVVGVYSQADGSVSVVIDDRM